jgi:hypothetical protein
MRRNPFWLLLAVALGVSLGYWWNRRGPHGASPTVLIAPVRSPAPEVPIQDRKTIDFSSGHPVVKDSAQEQALIDASARDMAEAAKNIRFEPTAAPAVTKPAEPANVPPKP